MNNKTILEIKVNKKTTVVIEAVYVKEDVRYNIDVNGKLSFFLKSICHKGGTKNGKSFVASIGGEKGFLITFKTMILIKKITDEAVKVWENSERDRLLMEINNKKEKEYDNIYNEGSEGYNPYRSPEAIRFEQVSK